MKTYKFIFIDLDDTIWDFRSNANSVLKKLYVDYDLNVHYSTFDDFFEVYINHNNELWNRYGKGEITREYLNLQRFLHPFSHVGINDSERALRMSKDFLSLLPFQTTLMPNAIDILNYLHSRYSLTIISNGFVEIQHKKMEAAGIGKYFSHIVLSESAGALKPDPKIFEYAIRINNANNNECIMIGDSFGADIIGAMGAGIDQVYFNNKVTLDTNQPRPTYIIKDLIELKEIL